MHLVRCELATFMLTICMICCFGEHDRPQVRYVKYTNDHFYNYRLIGWNKPSPTNGRNSCAGQTDGRTDGRSDMLNNVAMTFVSSSTNDGAGRLEYIHNIDVFICV